VICSTPFRTASVAARVTIPTISPISPSERAKIAHAIVSSERREARGQRQGRFETVEKGKIVFAITPARHGRQREAARHLVGQIDVVIDGGFADERGRVRRETGKE
jgi:hypothetical protein